MTEAEWGPLDGHANSLISEPIVSQADAVVQLIRQGRLVWASFPTPLGLAVGGLLRVARSDDGVQTLELAAHGPKRSLDEMARL